MKKTIATLAAVILGMTAWAAGPTNNPTAGTLGIVTDTNAVILTPTNFFAANSNLINAVVTAGTATNVAATNITGTIPTNNMPNTVVVGVSSNNENITTTVATNLHGQSVAIGFTGYAAGSTNGNFVAEATGSNNASITIRGDTGGGRTGVISVNPGNFQWGYPGVLLSEDTSGALIANAATFNGNVTSSSGGKFIGDGSGLTNLANGSLPSGTPAQTIVYSASSNAVAVTVGGDATVSTGGTVTLVNTAAARAHLGVGGLSDTNTFTGTNTFTAPIFYANGYIPQFIIGSGNPNGATATATTNWFYFDSSNTNLWIANGLGNNSWYRYMRTNDTGAGLTSLNASQLTSGTVPGAAFPATLPAVGGANLTGLNASQLTSGTIPSGAFPNPLPVLSGANLTSLNGGSVASGTVADARLSTNVALLNTSQTNSAATNTWTGVQNFTGGVNMTGSSLVVGTETVTNQFIQNLGTATNAIAAYWSNSANGYVTTISSNASIDSKALNFHYGFAATNIGNTNVASIGVSNTVNTNQSIAVVAVNSSFTNNSNFAALTVGVTRPNSSNEVFVGVPGASAEYTNTSVKFTGTMNGNGSGLTSLTAANLSGTVAVANGGTGSATGNASSLTNVYLGDGGSTGTFGSSNGMNPGFIRNLFYSSGSTAGYAAGTDAANIAVGESTNFNDSGFGWGSAVMGGGIGGTGGANIISLVAGPSALYLPTNRVSQLIPGGGYIVFSVDAVNDKFWGICSPGYNDGLSLDQGNYFGFLMDGEHGFSGMPLLTAASAGVYQPDDVVYQFTVSGVTTAPTFNAAVYSNNGHFYTAYSNNVSAGSGSLMMTCAYGAPQASGTLTKVSGTGDATIAFSASASLRTWTWGFRYQPSTGSVNIFSNVNAGGGITLTNGNIRENRLSVNQSGVNLMSSASTINLLMANNDGLAVQVSGGSESLVIGDKNDYVGLASAATECWDNATGSFDIGNASQLDTLSTITFSTLNVFGSIGSAINTYSGNRSADKSDSTIIEKANGVAVVTLPNSASHVARRQYQLVNDGTTNFTVITVSNTGTSTNLQIIGNNSTQTNLTIVPGQAVSIQSDGANWKFTYSPGLIQTNFISGQLYTNTYGRIIDVRAQTALTGAAVAGITAMELRCSGYLTNTNSLVTSATLTPTETNNMMMMMLIPAGNTYVFTNTSSGGGNSATTEGGQILVH